MSEQTQEVTLVVTYDDVRHAEPARWDWPALLDTEVRVVAANYSQRAHALVNQYDMVAGAWARANDEQDDGPSVKDAERYSEALEELAHQFAAFVRDVFGED